MEEAYEEDTHELDQEEMHWVNDSDEDIHLTRDEYSRSIHSFDYYEDQNPYGFTPSQCQCMFDNIMAELQHKYDLRPRIGNPKSSNACPPKKTILTKKTHETRMLPQAIVSPIPPKPQVTSQVMRTQLDIKDSEKKVPIFNLEQEIHKIKIQVPLSELSQNPIYKSELQIFLKAPSSNVEQDTINL